ncbi:TIGR02450 family Trp-rich protein [Thalassomonas viridans]|uniref:TIGR02450 family Trp-rich protein n=1 Tax=Thalassomonas viridans TaxID=137584 RepID=A0AAE9Z0T8_9GAMM|nr:TIGR02450 family Trp-rich protein [Thalassomonas viridans]WDE04736.1 TIGR02450 family Trp-rich protein [Thalassomonas viridans]
MNQVSPKTLLHSKWTKVAVVNKEKHFVVTAVEFDEDNKVSSCQVQAVINDNEYILDWRELKNSTVWRQGWQ